MIGSGSGGSTCANLLAQSGQRVLLLEQHSVTGGCTHSFREAGCEYDTGLHYISKAMSDRTTRPGAIMDFMSQGKQLWTPFSSQLPYDEIVFPKELEENGNVVKEGAPNEWSYKFYDGADRTTASLMESVDPRDGELRERVQRYFDICHDVWVCCVGCAFGSYWSRSIYENVTILFRLLFPQVNLFTNNAAFTNFLCFLDDRHDGFVALGILRLLPKWMSFLVTDKVNR